jgi:hypothetical protein
MSYLRAIRQPRLGWIVTADPVIPPAAQLAITEHRPGVRRLGRRLQLERRHPAPPGRRLPRRRPQLPMTGLACWRIRPRVGRDILPGQACVGEEIS